ncbi:MAG: nitroreductase family protein [Vampirovibrionales bacterium]|nr:nitroreductase family protein [Vampirovibrionales bacterium]
MDAFSAIRQRRSVKRFDPSQRMSEAQQRELIELAMLSPTSFNIQHWRFVVVNDPELRQQLRSAAWNQAQVSEAAMLVVLCADIAAWEKAPERYWADAPPATRDILLPMIDRTYRDRPQLQRDEAMRSCGIAAQTLMIAARAQGLDSCPMVGFDPQQVAELIRLPQDHVISLMIAIGAALEPARPRGGQLATEAVLIQDRFESRA